uniref:Protein son of sevenless n=1 Tax=Schistosoma mansoni TaxID=6183 RepID=A0A5K4FCE0_SCHMA
MTTVISRHTSTVSLVSQNSVQLEAGLLVQCLNRHKEYLECGCEKVLNSKFLKKGTGLSGLNNPNPSFGDDTADTALSSISGGTGFENITSSVVRRLDAGARESLGQHLIQLLATIVLPDPPQSISEVDTRLVDGLPGIPDKLMPSDSNMESYRNLAEKGRKKMLNLPFDKIFTALKEFSGRFNFNVCIYIVAIAEHVIGNFLQAAICYEDKALTENVIRASTVEKLFILYRDRVKPRRKMFEHRLATANLFPQDYDKCVDELCSFLHTCLEQMNLLIRVFREPILSVNPSSSTAGTSSYEQQTTTCTHTNEDNTQVLFGNILDVYNNMRILLDTIEAEDEDNYSPNIVKSKNNCTLLTSSTTPSSGMLNIVKPLNTSNNSTLITSGNDKTTLMDSLSETLTTLESIPEKRFPSDDDRNEMKNNIEHNNECSHRNISNNNSSGSIFHSPTLTDHTFSNDDNYDDRYRRHNKPDSSINNHSNSGSGSNNNNKNKTYPRRLVGICLIELAEDDSLHAFSRYANIVLDSNSRDRVWNLIEHENYAQELCQLSRTIVHTASLNNKYPGYNFFSSSTTTTTPVVDFHSFTCLHCQHWDTVVSKPRRRSTSTTATPLNDDNNYFNVHNNKNTMSTSVDSADKFDLTSNMSLNRHHHRSPHLLEMNTTSYAINCNYLVNATRYLLPRIILLPIFHFFYFHELIETLHRCAYDEVDRARLEDVLSMLRKTRATLERDLAKHPWVALHLVRLISTGQLTDRYRSLYLNAVSGASCPPSPVNYTAPPSPVGLSNQIGSHVSCASMSSTNCNASSSNIFNYHNTHHSTPTTAITTTSISINSTDLSFTYGNTVQNKAEEIEKLLSSKDKLIMSSNYLNTLGDFVMESRIHLRTTDSKKSSSEYIAYLFTGLLLICKWQERRSTPLNPNSVQQSILRIKYRIPLDLIHITDLPPIVQPNLIGYVGHSGPMTPSLVGAAVLAATSSNNSYSHNNNNTASNMNPHEETPTTGLSASSFFSSNFNGSISSHPSLASSSGSGGISAFPYLFELEYVDSSSCSPTTLQKSLNHSYNRHHHYMCYPGSQKSPVGRINYNEEVTTATTTTIATTTINGCNEGNSTLNSFSSSNSASEKFNFTNLSSSINVNHIRIFLRTPEEKADWIASLLSIQSYRLFIRYIRTLPRLEVSLRLPSSHIYKFSQPDSMDNIIFETNMPTSMLYPHKNSSITNQQEQYSHEQQSIIQSADVTNHFDSGKIRCFNESTSYLRTTGDTSPDGEREVEEAEEKDDDGGVDEDDDGVLIGSHSLTSSSIVVNSSPLSLGIGLSSQSSPITITSLSSNIENSTTTHNSNFTGTERSDDRNEEISESHKKQDNTKVMMSMLSDSGSSSTLTLTSHGSSNGCYNNNHNQTLTNGRTNAIKSLRDYAFQRQSSQSPNRSTEIVNMHTNQRFSHSSSFPPQIRMATLDKLIERLTYPTYFDTRLVNCFLLVYRRVTTSDELLDLLIERFRIPDPEFLPEEWNIEVEQGQLESPAQHMLKRFRSGYKKRIQSRVIMFLSRWVRNARYYQNDFAPNPRLRQKLLDFLSSIQARHLISSVERIKHYLQNPPISTQYPEAMTTTTIRTMETSKDNAELLSLLSSSDPTSVSSIESNQLRNFVNRITLNNIHPFKLAEQVTLYEWELYRRIPFWEVESRDRTGNAVPNLNKSKSFSNRFRSWLIYSILSEAHPDDRIVGIQRVIDLMLIMEHMNNLQGSQEAKSALISAAVYRLRKSFQAIRRMRHYREIVDRLRRESIHNPKCQRTSSSSSSSLSHQNNPMIDSNLSANHSIHNNNTSNTTSNNNSSNHFAGFGLPFSTGTSKSHERRIRVLEKQHASGELCHPCVPYIAAGVITRLIHLDLRHPDTIINDAGNVMINCWKHRQLADIVERYLAFQRIPYTYNVDDNVREFLEHVDPFELAGVSSEAEFESKMYQLSESYEPRDTETMNEPIIPEERRMTKEEIQAAQLLSNAPLKERISVPSVLQFNNLLNSPNNTANADNSNVNKSLLLLSSSSTSFTTNVSTDSTNEHKNSLKKSSHHPSSSSPSSQIGVTFINNDNNSSKHSHGEIQERKYLRIPNAFSVSSHISNTTVSGAKHQHSMSDSHVISPIISPSHQATNSMIGVTTAYSATAGLSPPSTPYPSSCVGCSHQPPPPPLPPRQGRQICNCWKHSKTPNSTGSTLHRIPTPPSSLHSSNTSCIFFSTIENCKCFPPPPPPPPPLPPKLNYSVRSTAATNPVTYSRSPDESSPKHSNFFQSVTLSPDTTTINTTTECSIAETAPPLPPRRNASNNTSTITTNTTLCNTLSDHINGSPDA